MQKTLSKNKLGFSVLELLLLIVIVGILGFVGWYVLSSKNEASKNYTNATTASTPMSALATVKIAYFGIQITVPTAIKDLTFYSSESNPGVLDISSVKLSTLDAACTASTTSDAANGLALGELTSPPNRDINTVAQVPHMGEGGQYSYIDYIKPTKSCSSDPKVLVSLNEYRTKLVNALKTIKPLK